MQFGYVNSSPFVTALVLSYAAKKVSEVAPGVGRNTDIKLVFREHIEELRPDVGNRLHELFIGYSEKANRLGIECIDSMHQYVSKPIVQDADEPPKGIPGGSAQINERTLSPAAETPRSDESGEKEAGQEGAE